MIDVKWRVHQERDKKGNPIERAWRYCIDQACSEDHHDYRPFWGVLP